MQPLNWFWPQCFITVTENNVRCIWSSLVVLAALEHTFSCKVQCVHILLLAKLHILDLFVLDFISLTIEMDQSSKSIHTKSLMLSCLKVSSPKKVVCCLHIQPHSSSQHMGRILPHMFLKWHIKGPYPPFQIRIFILSSNTIS